MEALTRHQVVLAGAIEDNARVLDAALLGGAVGPLDDPRFRVRLPLLLEGRHAEIPQRERRLSDTFGKGDHVGICWRGAAGGVAADADGEGIGAVGHAHVRWAEVEREGRGSGVVGAIEHHVVTVTQSIRFNCISPCATCWAWYRSGRRRWSRSRRWWSRGRWWWTRGRNGRRWQRKRRRRRDWRRWRWRRLGCARWMGARSAGARVNRHARRCSLTARVQHSEPQRPGRWIVQTLHDVGS